MRNNPFPLFDELARIFGKDRAVGNESANAMDALEKLEEEERDTKEERVPSFTEDGHIPNTQNRQMETPASSTSSSVRTNKARTETIDVLKDFSSKLEKMSGVMETASEHIGRLASYFQHEFDFAERRMQVTSKDNYSMAYIYNLDARNFTKLIINLSIHDKAIVHENKTSTFRDLYSIPVIEITRSCSVT
ncbi:hypothetical protein POM88_043235 [Heracleum sosnowskyi]|uniref:Uncharacterized protein n=1 Tax=Heracleum sosnowskyi TaxID=360622 RepID=A0AAD8H1M3_9APIA|nr:hypothetical protein POM88_043235 [Heracleum sosnowskyi]